MLDARKEDAFCTILREELQLATGCTEPIAVAYCAARLRQVLGERPRRILAEVSGNILKNVKSVVVPNTGGRRGLPAAIAVGVVAGDPEARLQVIAHVTEEDTAAIQAYLDSTDIRIDCPPTSRMLDIRLTGWAGDHKAVVHVANNHTNIIYVERDGEVLLEKPHSDSAEDNLQDKSVLNVRDILTFAETVDVSRIEESVGRQLECNTAIAREGLRGDWGANIGSTLLLSGGDVETEARAWAAAGSDARMNGCEMPVVICSGSGNQGITASVPVWRYGVQTGRDRETKLIATLRSPKTGRRMDVITDQPGVQCYTGQGLDHTGKGGVHYGRYAGVCLETQHYPDAIHHPHFESYVLRPQDKYDTFTIFRFTAE